MLDESASGVFTIAVTPFLPDGALDMASVATMTEFYLERGATGLTLLGIMGEAPKLTQAESLAVVRRVAEVAAGAVPIVVGVSSPGFAAMGELAAGAMEAGAAGVMVAPPGSLRTDAQIRDYYGNVARTLGDTSFVLQDFPLVTSVQITPQVLLDIFEAHPTCVMLKHEDWPGLDKISALRRASDAGARRISILCGNGGQFLPEEMARGADGAMTGFAFPEMMAGVVAASQAGDRARAQDIFDAYLPLVRYEAQPGRGLAIRKHILASRGAIAHASLRAPGAGLTPDAIAEVAFLLDRQKRRLAELGL
ncbi:dihydrodipicolinate synthase family protein [Acidimangrovimonas sediminis]|uniref:dihydrodipicolinate synthase family protein n=1 Tax=Acidimangrovimonas sediminis TaxID=2056283 RepID=UPI000C7FC7A9|nr:dihydrodipicolinate synthase family protein [Acidimangrovimonas sediminis]